MHEQGATIGLTPSLPKPRPVPEAYLTPSVAGPNVIHPEQMEVADALLERIMIIDGAEPLCAERIGACDGDLDQARLYPPRDCLTNYLVLQLIITAFASSRMS